MFPGDDIARLLPEHLKSFAADLKKYPEGYPSWLYGALQNAVYQGDILRSIKVVGVDEDGDAVSRDGPVVVISHTCDCQQGLSEFILVAPVFSIQERIEGSELTPQQVDNYLRDLRANRITELLFLPGVGALPDSFVDFSQVCAIASAYFHSAAFLSSDHRVISLSQKGHYFFLMKMSYHFCRSDPKDSTRQS